MSVGENRNEEIKNKRDQKSGAGRIESKRKFSYSFMFAAGRRAYTGRRYGFNRFGIQKLVYFDCGRIFDFCVDGVFKYGVAFVTLTAASGGRVEFSAAFSGFHNLGCSFSANFLQNLYLTLWALLPCIPILLSIFIPFPSFLYIPIFLAAYVLVVIKSYSYSMAYFLLCDRPYIFGGKEAIALSRKMTDGNKVTLFLLDLSFIGWFLLSILSFGVLWIVYVNAYYNTARAYLFIQIQKQYYKS